MDINEQTGGRGKKTSKAIALKKKIQLDYIFLPGCDWNVQQDKRNVKAVHETAHDSYLATQKKRNNGNTDATYSF